MTSTTYTATTTTRHLNTLLGKERPAGEPTPISEVALGDIVAIHSRGQYRTAVVTKIGRTNVTTSYITQGGVDRGREVLALHQDIVDRGRDAFLASFTERHESNWNDHAKSAATPNRYDNEARTALNQAIVDGGRDAFMARCVARDNETFDGYVNDVTTKSPEDKCRVTDKSAKEFWVMGR